ncbi:hypothetical protein Dsin_030567 [Dipteronia sinensis]|uniref:Zinc knuckle CX2CX4HX4C domain-containing protein n=1 Tax=Dipteronia sinensis TaxID=43782 RepID=A0AAD9ZJS2_9ROSI|nr:hypothetical protein Dsin_030567 [Dipteronia sinensis]
MASPIPLSSLHEQQRNPPEIGPLNQLGTLKYDLEWTNGTSYVYTLDSNKECRVLHFSVGILRPNWLDGATYLGQEHVDGFLCNVWTKVDFILYYEDVVTKRPVHWVFFNGYTAHVMTFEVGAVLEDPNWQAPVYCFGKDKDKRRPLLESMVVTTASSLGKLIRDVNNDVNIESVSWNTFTFHFSDMLDLIRVIAGGPWSFDNALIAMERPAGKGTIDSLSFSLADFWIQIHQIPLLCMTREIGCFLGGLIGQVLDVDGGASGECVGKFMRVRVRIDIKKPLKRCLRVDIMGDGSETVMVLIYERLSNHCFKCGWINHTTAECTEKEPIPIVNGKAEPLFGIWLRASGLPHKFYGQYHRRVTFSPVNTGNFRRVDRRNEHAVAEQTTGEYDSTMPTTIAKKNGVMAEISISTNDPTDP